MLNSRRIISAVLATVLCSAYVLQPISVYADIVSQDQEMASGEFPVGVEQQASTDAEPDLSTGPAAESASDPDKGQVEEPALEPSTDSASGSSIGAEGVDAAAESDSNTLSIHDLNSWRYDNGELRDDLEEQGAALLSLTPLPEGVVAQGIDVSSHQGVIDWDKVKAAGVDFAILRIGYGSQAVDSQWDRNVRECERLGIPWGAYLYGYAANAEDARFEASFVLRCLSGLTPDLPIYYDLEDFSILSGDVNRDRTAMAEVATVFCSMVENAGFRAGIYANLNWWNTYLTDSCFNQWERWVAQYNTACSYQGEYSMWQYTSSGFVDGIYGANGDTKVDVNYWYGEPFTEPEIDYTGWVDDDGNECDAEHASGWVDAGFPAESKFFFDPSTNGWYWAEADGSIAKNHDAFVPLSNQVAGNAWENASTAWRMANGKWVRLGADGKMIKGEDAVGGKWYYFDPVSGEMAHGFRLITGGDGTKWVFYDYTSGVMVHGEVYIDDAHGDEPGWMYMDDISGAVVYGWREIDDGDGGAKWVYYDEVTGRMVHGRRTIDGYSRNFDEYTGACDKIGYQNPIGYFQVSSNNVTLPKAAYSTPYSYVTPSRIDVDATHEDCVNAMVTRAYEYLGAPYVWNYSLSPSQGVDCSGLVMQCLFACGMDLGDYNPYMHWYDPWHAHDANNMAADPRFMHVSFDDRQKGDLIFYPGHVAVYIGNDRIIEAYTPVTGVRTAGVYSGGLTVTAVARPLV